MTSATGRPIDAIAETSRRGTSMAAPDEASALKTAGSIGSTTIQRHRDVGQQHGGVVVGVVDGDPSHPGCLVLGPLRQQRRLAVAGRGDDAHHRRCLVGEQPGEQFGPGDDPRSRRQGHAASTPRRRRCALSGATGAESPNGRRASPAMPRTDRSLSPARSYQKYPACRSRTTSSIGPPPTTSGPLHGGGEGQSSARLRPTLTARPTIEQRGPYAAAEAECSGIGDQRRPTHGEGDDVQHGDLVRRSGDALSSAAGDRVQRREQLGARRRAQLGTGGLGPHDLLERCDCVSDRRVAVRAAAPLGAARRLEVVVQRDVDRIGAHVWTGRGPRQPRRRGSLVGDDVVCRPEVPRLAGQREADQHTERRPERRHERGRDTLHVVVLASRHDDTDREPRSEGDEEGGHQTSDDEHSPPAARSASPRRPTAGSRARRTAAARRRRRSAAPDR